MPLITPSPMNNRLIFVIISVLIVLVALLWFGNYSGLIQTSLTGAGRGIQAEIPVEVGEIVDGQEAATSLPLDSTAGSCEAVCQESCQDFAGSPVDLSQCLADCQALCADNY